MLKKIFIILIVLLCLCTTMVMAKNDSTTQEIGLRVKEVAALRINPDNADISFSIQAPDTAGGVPQITAPDSSTYLQFTSIRDLFYHERVITAEVKSFPFMGVPFGTKLIIEADDPTTIEGTTGNGSTITFYPFDLCARNLITGIKSGYTGTGAKKGSNLMYTFSINNWDTLKAAIPRDINIEYTLTDA